MVDRCTKVLELRNAARCSPSRIVSARNIRGCLDKGLEGSNNTLRQPQSEHQQCQTQSGDSAQGNESALLSRYIEVARRHQRQQEPPGTECLSDSLQMEWIECLVQVHQRLAVQGSHAQQPRHLGLLNSCCDKLVITEHRQLH